MAREAPTVRFRMPRDTDGIVVWSDERLLRQFLTRSGEAAEAAFATLIERHGPVVHRVCLAVLGARDESQDAAQAVFLVLARRAGSIRNPGSLGPWLHGVALRVARRARNQAARRRAVEREKAEIIRRRPASAAGPDPMDFAELHEEIDRLPEKYRQPIILCYMQGLTQTRAAEALGWPLGTVQARLHRGRERLRGRLARRGAGMMGLAMAALLMPTRAMAAPRRAWTEATARSAVRLAAGQGTAGLVAPAVSGLAESALKAMFLESLKGAAMMVLALAAVGLSTTVPKAGAGQQVAASRLGPAAVDPVPPARDVPAPVVARSDRAERPAPSPKGSGARPLPPTSPTVVAIGFEPPVSPGPALAPAGPPREKAASTGRELFERSWVKDDPRGHGGDGLGPVFNGRSCVECHNLGGSGGAGAADRNIEIATVTEEPAWGGYSYAFNMDLATGRFEYRMGFPQASPREARTDPRLLASIHPGFGGSRSVVLHHYGTDPAYFSWRESVAGRHGTLSVRSSRRNPPPLFGLGPIDAIPDEAIEAAARRKLPGSAQVKGRVSRLKDGRVGRFGWKAQTATLAEFVRSAAAGEMGLELPGRHQAADPRLPGLAATGLDMDEAECTALVDHVRSLPMPVAIDPGNEADSAQIKAGEATFKSIGCTGCHLPKLGDVEGIYSDLLLHDMGPQPVDSDGYTVFSGEPAPAVDRPGAAAAASATAREWRTPPLWGLRDSGPYLHDGRAARVDQAIALHAGQGAASARRHAELSPRRKRQLEAFLMSLAAPPGDR
jgi:RNA polymerase sigma factor (sigma-70 family)